MSAGTLQPDAAPAAANEDADARPAVASDAPAAGAPAVLVLQPIGGNLSLRDQAYAALKQAMFDEFRTLAPGEHIDEYSDANIAFHQAIIRLSGSHLMGTTIENVLLHVRAIRRMTIAQSDRAARSIVDHMRIIEALEKRDTELAERLVRQHSLDLAAHVEKHCDFLD